MDAGRKKQTIRVLGLSVDKIQTQLECQQRGIRCALEALLSLLGSSTSGPCGPGGFALDLLRGHCLLGLLGWSRLLGCSRPLGFLCALCFLCLGRFLGCCTGSSSCSLPGLLDPFDGGLLLAHLLFSGCRGLLVHSERARGPTAFGADQRLLGHETPDGDEDSPIFLVHVISPSLQSLLQ